jgi:carbon storage regulator CsrA
MLVLSRKLKQEILIGENVKITVLKVKGNTVRLGIEAPRDVHVVRGELPQFDEPKTKASNTETSNDAIAEFTVVFSNAEEGQTPKVDVIPFETGSRSGSQGNSASRQSATDPLDPESVSSIRFRDRLPSALQHNRLKEMVNQLTTKSSN